MAFSDDDLRDVKKTVVACEGYEYGVDLTILQAKALLARLDAADNVCRILNTDDSHTTGEWIKLIAPAIKAWKESAGKS